MWSVSCECCYSTGWGTQNLPFNLACTLMITYNSYLTERAALWSQVYPTGKMGKHVDSLKIGDTLEMKVC